jgi:hypothetical protein
MWEVMSSYVILQNIIVNSERGVALVFDEPCEMQGVLLPSHHMFHTSG